MQKYLDGNYPDNSQPMSNRLLLLLHLPLHKLFIPRVIIGLEVGIVIQIQFSQYHTSGITIRIPEYMLCSQIIFYCG